uniref:Uncharacterized protein n=1 Tax=Salix viminalis TaxID=40686 RepID=A0A6N2MQL3_SALVM
MATGAADGFFRYVHDGCLAGGEVGFDRRPYHRNCRCALHNSKENCSHTMSRYKNVSYPIKRCWSEGNLALMVANSSSSSSNSPPSSLQAGRSATTPHQRRSSHDLDVEDHVYSFKREATENNCCKVILFNKFQAIPAVSKITSRNFRTWEGKFEPPL